MFFNHGVFSSRVSRHCMLFKSMSEKERREREGNERNGEGEARKKATASTDKKDVKVLQ